MALNLMVRAGADFSAITKQAKQASDGMKGLNNAFASAGSVMKRALGALGVVASLTAIVSAAKDAKAAYDQQIEAETKLAQVMRNTMGASNAEIQAIKDLTSAQQALGVIGDEVQLAGAQELATYLAQTSSLKKLIPVMNDMVAQQYGYSASAESAATIATMMGKVMSGQTTALKRLGYTFSSAQEQVLKYGTEEQRAATLAEVVEQSVGGMNAALANTPTGRMQQLKNTLGDIKESFGQAVTTIATVFLPLLSRVANMLANIATIANRVAQAIANVFGKKMSSGTAVAASGVSAAADAMDDLADSAGAAGKAAKKATESVLGFDVLNKLTDPTSATSGKASAATDSANAIGGLADAEEEAAESSTWLENALTRIRDLIASLNFEPLRAAVARLKEAFGALAEVIGGALSWAFDNVLTPLAHWTIEKWWPALIEELAAQWEFLAAALKAVKPFALWIWENFLKPLAEWTGEAVVKALEDLKAVFEGLTDVLEGKTTISEFLKNLSPDQGVITALLTAALAIKAISLAMSGIKAATAIASGALTLLTNPAGLVVVAIAAVIAIGIVLYQHWDEIKAKFQAGWEELKGDWERLKASFADAGEAIKTGWTNLQTHWNDTVKPKLKAGWEELKSDFSSMKDSLATAGTAIKTGWTGLQSHWNNTVKPKLQAGWETLKSDFSSMKDSLATAGDAIKTGWTNLQAHWNDTVKPKLKAGWDALKGDFSGMKDSLVSAGDAIKAGWTDLQTHWETSVKPKLQESWIALQEDWSAMKESLAAAGEAIKRGWTNLKTRWSSVKQSISDKIGELETKWTSFKDLFGSVKDAIVNFAQNLWSGISSPFSSIGTAIDTIVSKCQSAIEWLDSLSSRGEARIEANGGIWASLGGFASGGWPDTGSLFIAREAGPELVGTIGGQTAVANNADIVAAVASGVAQAVAAVMNSSRGGNDRPIILNINGREFARATYNDMRAVQKERGTSLVNG